MKVLLTILMMATAVTAAEFYASPNGSGSACSFASPCSLQRALNNQARMGPGDTLYLRGGTYTGKWTSNLDGGVVKSFCGKSGACRPDDPEWAVIDGNYASSITNSMSAYDTKVKISGPLEMEPGMVVTVEGEDIQINAGSFPNYTVVRGWNGTRATAHVAGSPLRLRGNQLAVNGSGTTYRDFEIIDSNPVRAYSVEGYGGYLRGGEGIFNFCVDCKFINLVIHDNADGIFESATAKRTEIYGNLIFNNGHVAIVRPHGHGLYIQNACPGDKVIRNNIVFNNFVMGSTAYGASQGRAECLVFEEETHFNNGSPGYYRGTPTKNGDGNPNRRYGNLEIGSDVFPSMNITVRNSNLYQPPNKIVELGGLPIGRAPAGGNRNVTVEGNTIVEPWAELMRIDRWTGVTVTGNAFVFNEKDGGEFLVNVVLPTTANKWDSNTYYAQSKFFSCNGARFRAPFTYGRMEGHCGSIWLTFAQWKKFSGFDANSTFTESLPSKNIVKVIPNIYEPGRNHIVVYNFTNAASFQFLPQGLERGKSYSIYDTQNWGTVYQSGVYNGEPITVKLDASAPVKGPIGSVYTPPTTQPYFASFVLIPR